MHASLLQLCVTQKFTERASRRRSMCTALQRHSVQLFLRMLRRAYPRASLVQQARRALLCLSIRSVRSLLRLEHRVQPHTQYSGALHMPFLVRVLLTAHSRLVLGIHVENTEQLVAALRSPLFWSGLDQSCATINVRVHHPAILAHLAQMYALTPPRSSQAVHDAAAREHGEEPVPAASVEPDASFLTVLQNVGTRGPLGTPSEQGWWRAVNARMHAADACVAGAVVPIDDVLAGTLTPGILEIHAALPGGKYTDELAGFALTADHTLRIVALGAPTATGTDAHAELVKSLPFSLSETEGQRERRDQVPLPYAHHVHNVGSTLRGTTGKSDIFFEPESDDDEDDEDPDDDLDL